MAVYFATLRIKAHDDTPYDDVKAEVSWMVHTRAEENPESGIDIELAGRIVKEKR